MFSPHITLLSLYLFYISIITGLWRDSLLFKGLLKFFVYPSFVIFLSFILGVIFVNTGIPWTRNASYWVLGVAILFSLLSIRNSAFFLSSYEEETKKECPNCGEIVNKIAKVCHHCGYRFKGRKKTT